MKYTIKNEEYLLSISNKGILNRSIKDLDNIEIKYTDNDDSIELNFSDVTVVIKEEISSCTCTCPSSSICKHIITSLLFLNNINSDSTDVEEFNDEEILSQDYKKLFKALGANYQKEFLQNISSSQLPEINKTAIVTLSPTLNVTVKILNPLELSTCTCQTKTLCKHKALAFLYYLAYLGKVDISMFEVSKSDQQDFLTAQNYCVEIRDLINDALRVGLSRTSFIIVDKFERAALHTQVLQLAKLSGMLRDISGTFGSYFDQDVFFNEATLLNKLFRVYGICNKIINAKNYAEFSKYCGVFREEYVQVPSLSLVCIAVKNISTKSGYVGMGSYFIDENTSNIYSFSSVQPNFYDNDLPIRIIAPWGLGCDFENMENKKILLRYPKITSDGRLSSSKDTVAMMLKDLRDDPLKDNCIINDYRELITMEDLTINQRIKVVSFNKVESFCHNPIKQALIINILDSNNYKIVCEVKQIEENKFLYDELVHLLNNRKKFNLVGSIYQTSELYMYVQNYIEVIV